jgi:hypothetical protein
LSHLEEYDRRRYGSVLLIFYGAAEDLRKEEEEADEFTEEDELAEKDVEGEQDVESQKET